MVVWATRCHEQGDLEEMAFSRCWQVYLTKQEQMNSASLPAIHTYILLLDQDTREDAFTFPDVEDDAEY